MTICFNMFGIFLPRGDFQLAWQVADEKDLPDKTIDVTLSITEEMEGPGYLGIGWEKSVMNGAQIWFCTVNEEVRKSLEPLPTECDELPKAIIGNSSFAQESAFTCCLAPGTHHNKPECSDPSNDPFYELEVVDWCLSATSSSVTVRATVCGDDETDSAVDSEPARNCFRMAGESGELDFIVAYNTIANSRPHGYQRRTNAQVNLEEGILTEGESATADDGLIATHGAFMLIGWMLLAPWGVFVRTVLSLKFFFASMMRF